MCMGGGSPRPQPKEPEAPVAPVTDAASRDRDRKRQQRAASSTLLTGGQGVTSATGTAQKTLLGA